MASVVCRRATEDSRENFQKLVGGFFLYILLFPDLKSSLDYVPICAVLNKSHQKL